MAEPDKLFRTFFGNNGEAAVLACDKLGVLPYELLHIPFYAYLDMGASGEQAQIRYNMRERFRQDLYRKLFEERRLIVESGEQEKLWEERCDTRPDAPGIPDDPALLLEAAHDRQAPQITSAPHGANRNEDEDFDTQSDSDDEESLEASEFLKTTASGKVLQLPRKPPQGFEKVKEMTPWKRHAIERERATHRVPMTPAKSTFIAGLGGHHSEESEAQESETGDQQPRKSVVKPPMLSTMFRASLAPGMMTYEAITASDPEEAKKLEQSKMEISAFLGSRKSVSLSTPRHPSAPTRARKSTVHQQQHRPTLGGRYHNSLSATPELVDPAEDPIIPSQGPSRNAITIPRPPSKLPPKAKKADASIMQREGAFLEKSLRELETFATEYVKMELAYIAHQQQMTPPTPRRGEGGWQVAIRDPSAQKPEPLLKPTLPPVGGQTKKHLEALVRNTMVGIAQSALLTQRAQTNFAEDERQREEAVENLRAASGRPSMGASVRSLSAFTQSSLKVQTGVNPTSPADWRAREDMRRYREEEDRAYEESVAEALARKEESGRRRAEKVDLDRKEKVNIKSEVGKVRQALASERRECQERAKAIDVERAQSARQDRQDRVATFHEQRKAVAYINRVTHEQLRSLRTRLKDRKTDMEFRKKYAVPDEVRGMFEVNEYDESSLADLDGTPQATIDQY